MEKRYYMPIFPDYFSEIKLGLRASHILVNSAAADDMISKMGEKETSREALLKLLLSLYTRYQ